MDLTQLQDKLAQTIQQFNDNRAGILANASQQGGQDAVTAMEDKYEVLNEQYNQMLAAALDVNNAAYGNLSDRAGAEADILQASVTDLTDIDQTITALSTVISVVATIVTLV